MWWFLSTNPSPPVTQSHRGFYHCGSLGPCSSPSQERMDSTNFQKTVQYFSVCILNGFKSVHPDLCVFVHLCAVVVAKGNTGFTLTCNADPDAAVSWKFTVGKVMESIASYNNVQQDGQNLNISKVDTPNVGEYSCWSGGKMLSSVHLLLQANEEDELGEIILFHFSIIPSVTWW